VYIPSVAGCSGFEAFYEMAVEVSKMITVSDAVLENKILRAIIKDFNPIEFLQMLSSHVSKELPVCETHPTEKSSIPLHYKNEEESDILPDPETGQTRTGREPGGYKLFSGKSKRNQIVQKDIQQEIVTRSDVEPVMQSTQTAVKKAEMIDTTQSTSILSNNPELRYIGHAHLPPSIQVKITEGEIFTIGRFDAAVGKKQSSFEFDKKTKAVSRRHAAIERDIEGFKIVDLSSSAGTFVNNKKLPPNTPYGLETGSRVSFGNSGADYVWEIS